MKDRVLTGTVGLLFVLAFIAACAGMFTTITTPAAGAVPCPNGDADGEDAGRSGACALPASSTEQRSRA